VLFHPFTGEEIAPDDLEALEQAEVELHKYLGNLGPLYGIRRELRAAIAAQRKLAGLPRPRFRTDVQQAVSECPRCSHRHGAEKPQEPRVAEENPFHVESADAEVHAGGKLEAEQAPAPS
jgi:hypothetical protein